MSALKKISILFVCVILIFMVGCTPSEEETDASKEPKPMINLPEDGDLPEDGEPPPLSQDGQDDEDTQQPEETDENDPAPGKEKEKPSEKPDDGDGQQETPSGNPPDAGEGEKPQEPEPVTEQVTVTIKTPDETFLSAYALEYQDGWSAFSALETACKDNAIPFVKTGSKTLVYIKSLNGIAEFSDGGMSGWLYEVNGERPSVGCGAHFLKAGDEVVFRYSLDGN